MTIRTHARHDAPHRTRNLDGDDAEMAAGGREAALYMYLSPFLFSSSFSSLVRTFLQRTYSFVSCEPQGFHTTSSSS
jgi:hypothetical protein